MTGNGLWKRKEQKRKTGWAVGLAALLLLECLVGCQKKTVPKLYTAQFLSLFDTVTQIQGYAAEEEEFKELTEEIRKELESYHQLYNAYESYEGIINIKTLNERTGQESICLDPRLWELLKFGQELYEKSEGRVNIGMGSVLQIWHEYREEGISNPYQAQIPSLEELRKAALHTDLKTMILRKEDHSVQFLDEELKLDVGAIAKGYALEQVCRSLSREGQRHLLISIGGNIRALGPKWDNSPWQVKIPNPLNPSKEPAAVVELAEGSLVSSGVYQRYYTVEGRRYHHIIDPDSLFPEERYLAVTVQMEDSGFADGLSTALFNLDQEAGEALAGEAGASACWWVLPDGQLKLWKCQENTESRKE